MYPKPIGLPITPAARSIAKLMTQGVSLPRHGRHILHWGNSQIIYKFTGYTLRIEQITTNGKTTRFDHPAPTAPNLKQHASLIAALALHLDRYTLVIGGWYYYLDDAPAKAPSWWDRCRALLHR